MNFHYTVFYHLCRTDLRKAFQWKERPFSFSNSWNDKPVRWEISFQRAKALTEQSRVVVTIHISHSTFSCSISHSSVLVLWSVAGQGRWSCSRLLYVFTFIYLCMYVCINHTNQDKGTLVLSCQIRRNTNFIFPFYLFFF